MTLAELSEGYEASAALLRARLSLPISVPSAAASGTGRGVTAPGAKEG